MTAVNLIMDGDQCWPDLDPATTMEARLVAVARLARGTVAGNTSVTFRLELPDGRPVICQTTLATLRAAVAGMVAADELDAAKGRRPPGSVWVAE